MLPGSSEPIRTINSLRNYKISVKLCCREHFPPTLDRPYTEQKRLPETLIECTMTVSPVEISFSDVSIGTPTIQSRFADRGVTW